MDRIRVLFVDDEQNILDGIARRFRQGFSVSTANSGKEGLALLEKEEPFAVVVSDMRMPEMNGAAFLKLVKETSPDSVRMLLTGYADMESAIDAVNQGNIFRFLTKPCAHEVLEKALQDAAKQHHLLVSEHVLLEQTLHGSIKALTDILALANPLIFSRASRAKRQAGDIASQMELPNRWEIEIAAMLSQIACITLPPATAEKVYYGKRLDEHEKAMVEKLPEVTRELLGNIPRLDGILAMLAQLSQSGTPALIGAQVLQIVLDGDELETSGLSSAGALVKIRENTRRYDENVLKAFVQLRAKTLRAQSFPLTELHEGMIFGENVLSLDGKLLVSKGQEATNSLLERLKNFEKNIGIKQPITMIV